MTNSLDFQKILEEIEQEVKQFYGIGEVANYIPELANIDPDSFSMSVHFLSGQHHSVGSFDKPFSIQSISKVFLLVMAMKMEKSDLWKRVGKEPSGNSFNSLVQLEGENGIPRNPFINAGALVTTDSVVNRSENAYSLILDFVRRLACNNDINYNLDVANSEIEVSDRNMALAYFMKSFKNITSDPQDLVDIYCHHCSLELTTLDLSRAFLFLANNGAVPETKEKIISSTDTKRINSLMITSGLYDNVGEFAYKVGLPAKSGVGGGIVAVMPGLFTVSVWSPRLNSHGNSFIGLKALELFTDKTGISIF